MDIQVPIKKAAIDYVKGMDEQAKAWREEVKRLTQPAFGASDPDEAIRDNARAEALREAASFLERHADSMAEPTYTPSKELRG